MCQFLKYTISIKYTQLATPDLIWRHPEASGLIFQNKSQIIN
jgi:hypothetical protein